MVAFFFPPLGFGRTRVATYLSYVDDNSNSQNYSFSSYNIGTPAPDRRIFGIIHWVEGSAHRSLASCTIGGVSATIHGQIGHTGGSTGLGVAIVSALVPTGTTATITINASTPAWGGVAFSAIYTTGMQRSTPFDTDTDEHQSTTADLTSSTNVDTSGLLIAAMTGSTNAVNDTVVWTGVTEQYDLAAAPGIHASMAWQSGLATETGRSIVADITPRINSGNDMVVVSWS